jgi:diguanylate cyclase (GGDEF)-like protein/PAS domain S-box-containing protein
MRDEDPRIRTIVAIVVLLAFALPVGYMLLSSASVPQDVRQISAAELRQVSGEQTARQAGDIAAILAVRLSSESATRETAQRELELMVPAAGNAHVRVLGPDGTELLGLGANLADGVSGEALVGSGPFTGSRVEVTLTMADIDPAAAAKIADVVIAAQERIHGTTGLLILICLVSGVAGFLLLRRRPAGGASRAASVDRQQPVRRGAATERALQELAISRTFLEQLLDSVHDAVLFVGADRKIVRANDQALKLLEHNPESILGQQLASLVPDDKPGFFDTDGRLSPEGETGVSTRAGHQLHVSFRSGTLESPDGDLNGYVLVLRNLTDESRSRKRIRYLTRFDSLTRVANRMQFQHKLQQSIARAMRNDLQLAVLYLDLDRFKDINDTFGHPVGDRALEITARRVVDALDPGTLVGRLAGDEFAVLFDSLPTGDDLHPTLAATARMLLDQISKEFHVERRELFITASIGIAVCPSDADNVVDLIRNADAAMYHAKQNGGNTYGFYAPQMNADAVDRLVLKNELRHAMRLGEFQVLYQPKIDLRDGRVTGAEALLRWRHPKRGEVPPSVFIPLAEDSGLIFEIGAWVLDQVCRDYANWQTRLPWPGRIAVNLSLQQLRQKDFVSSVEKIFEDHRLTPSCLELEITESTLMRDGERTLRMLDRLYQLGLHLSIDDFGTGYSSLSALQHFPIETLKIDQSFVSSAAESPDRQALVSTIINMGGNLGMDVVAEGVETVEQLRFLQEQGCNYAQGHLFGDPVAADEYLRVLVEQERGESRHAGFFS